MPTTAAGSVVATMAPSRRQTIRPYDETASTAKPTTRVHTTTATMAIIRIGPISSISRRTFIDNAVSNSSTGRNTIRKVSDEISKCSMVSSRSPSTGGAQPCKCTPMPSRQPTSASSTE
ncbi:Uncharacterised protein [Bordetella pertussis]|nr:Uncharacterised protein [Bordetella pertussis]